VLAVKLSLNLVRGVCVPNSMRCMSPLRTPLLLLSVNLVSCILACCVVLVDNFAEFNFCDKGCVETSEPPCGDINMDFEIEPDANRMFRRHAAGGGQDPSYGAHAAPGQQTLVSQSILCEETLRAKTTNR
jgi:hypothetical protein